MSTFPLPPHDQPGLDLLLNRDLWSRWQADGVVFPLDSFRAACRYFRFKPDTTSRLYVAGVDQQSASEPPEGIMLHIFPDAERARVAYAKEMSKLHKIGTGGYQPFLCDESCMHTAGCEALLQCQCVVTTAGAGVSQPAITILLVSVHHSVIQ